MGRTRGFRLPRKVVKIFKWCVSRRTRRRSTAHRRLELSAGPISKLCRWVRGACWGLQWGGKTSPRYIHVGEEPVEQPRLPKGHLAVYVGDEDDDTCRVLVPVVHVNHPLFGELLGEAETVYGFNHPGGIQIPCPKSELESVQMRIAAASGGAIWRTRRR